MTFLPVVALVSAAGVEKSLARDVISRKRGNGRRRRRHRRLVFLRHVLVDPVADVLGDVVAILFQHHLVAVAVYAHVFERARIAYARRPDSATSQGTDRIRGDIRLQRKDRRRESSRD